MAQNIFKGLGVALITPFNTDGSVDYQSLKRLVEFQIDNGADFLCILATTGEAPCLTQEEKDKITELVKDVNKGRIKILKYCGGNNTAAVVEEIKNTDWSGIDGILSICPYYNKPSQEGLYQHFKAIAQVSPLPIVLYNVPGRTGINMKPKTTCRIARDFPNVVAVKEASGSLEQVDEIIKNKPDNFDVISGDDALTFSMIASGAAGVISVIGNALPKAFSRMIRLEFRGEYEPARKIHHSFTELYSLLFVDGNPAGVKALLNDMGFIENELRLPLVPTRIATKQKMSDILKTLSRCENARTLASSSYAKVTVEDDSRRILKVKNFISKNYMDELRLPELASLAGMSSSAFSRFFKLHTGRNISEYIIDLRLGYAARMLVDTAKSISEIGFDCGFNNLSNFNRIFKKKKGCSPSEFRESYHKTRIIV